MSSFPGRPVTPEQSGSRSVSVEESKQHLHIVEETLRDGRLRRSLVWPLFAFFIIVKILVDAFVWSAYLNDNRMIVAHLEVPTQRLVTPAIIGALIAATTAQLGAIALVVFKALFGARE